MTAISEQAASHLWLALGRVEGLGVRSAQKLIEHFGSPGAVYAASISALEGAGLTHRVAQQIRAGAGQQDAEKELTAAEKLGCRLIPFGSGEYPSLLKQIADPPLALYVRGDASLLSRYSVAIVGTRRPSAYGSSVAHRLAADLAQRQLVIVSGMARGVDSAAHRGALEVNGRTVAVFGCGVDIIYPRDNKRLADSILASGAFVSEFPLGTSPQPENFPIRNRIISGLGLGVVIVEAAEYSGSLITARLASEQDREVYAVPGNITSPQSFGPNLLIKQGAKLVDNWMDVVEEFPATVRAQLIPAVTASFASGEAETRSLFEPALSGDQKAVYEVLRPDKAAFVDDIFSQAGLPQPRVLAALLELEMGGFIRQLPGKNFVRKL
ncbi:MAG TPA: DNA-processing protein DprA [Terriglobia bacterium]|nr:DNA-processing protein DprA [Terriglobia bacterium]